MQCKETSVVYLKVVGCIVEAVAHDRMNSGMIPSSGRRATEYKAFFNIKGIRCGNLHMPPPHIVA